MFCDNVLKWYPIGGLFFGNHAVGVIRLIVSILYVMMMLLTIFWIHLQGHNARMGDSKAVKSVIFPIFVRMMWLSAFSNLTLALLMLFMPVELTSRNASAAKLLYPLAYTLQHAVMEGIAFLLMQKGCGKYAATQAGRLTLIWCAITLLANIMGHARTIHYAAVIQGAWSFSILVFYLLLWILPENRLFRRPAAIPYAKFWFFFRVLELTFFILSQLTQTVPRQIGQCGYVFGPLFIYTLFQPLVMYVTLLEDSRWWQGLQMESDDSRYSIHSPLGGLDLSLSSAQALALTMDSIGETRSARLLNFAHIAIDKAQLLGQGSFSRVYRGTYRRMPCAIKLVYTMDLTEEVIVRVAVEATILSSLQHRNIIRIYGISVLPPSVCILLEICEYGSLSDILRGDTGGGKVKRPLQLSETDRMWLALGCARGVAALHALGPEVVHRDIKSLNFLVDGQLNAKLADLELGSGDILGGSPQNGGVARHGIKHDLPSEELLQNWAAPELLRDQPYTQACDVYALSLVLWEVVSNKVPFADAKVSIRDLILRGHRPPIPPCPAAYSEIVCMGWTADAQARPSASCIVETLERIMNGCADGSLTVIEAKSDISCVVDTFFRSDEGQNFSRGVLKHRSYMETRNSFSVNMSISSQHNPAALQMTDVSVSPGSSVAAARSISQEECSPRVDMGEDVVSEIEEDDSASDDLERGPHRETAPPPSKAKPSVTTSSLYTVDLPASDVQSATSRNFRPSDSGAGPAPTRPTSNILCRPSPDNRITIVTSAEGSRSSLMQLQSIYDRISASPPWKIIDELPDSVLVLSGSNTPHILLKSSMAFLSVMGLSAAQVFGKCLEDFLVGVDGSSARANGRCGPGAPGDGGGDMSTGSPSEWGTGAGGLASLKHFYAAMDLGASSSCVLHLRTCLGLSVAFSVHAFPIYRRSMHASETEAALNVKGESGRTPMVLLPFLGRGAAEGADSGEVAFYVLYLNNFNRVVDGSAALDGRDHLNPLVSVDVSAMSGSVHLGRGLPSDSFSVLTPPYDGTSVLSNMTEDLRKQGLANDL